MVSTTSVADALSRINSDGLAWSAAATSSPSKLGFGTLQALALRTAFRSFDDLYDLPCPEACPPLKPVHVSPEELARAHDDEPPLAQLKQHVLQQDFSFDRAMRQLHPATASFPRSSPASALMPECWSMVTPPVDPFLLCSPS